MIDKYLSANIEDNDTLSADVQDEDVEVEMPDFVAMGGGNGEDGFSPIVSLIKDGKVSTLEIIDKNGTHKTEILDGTDGEDGQDGFSPIATVTDIEGGHRVTITDKQGNKTFEVMDGKDGQGGIGGGKAIIDVVELPTENIDEDSFYRLMTGSLVYNQFVQTMYNCYCVETLPETGKPATNPEQTEGNVYYNLADGEVYGYVDAILSMGLGVPSGWYPAGVLLGALGYRYSGVITDILDDPIDASFRFLLKYVIYSHKDGRWTSHEVIGWRGTGISAEIFNHPSNDASGAVSHAEGWGTAALGIYSHAEGQHTVAVEDWSHAEGGGTRAGGVFSHTEGDGTVSKSLAQHVQGTFNILENDSVATQRGKYAHIVGNGSHEQARSNAHTLDWLGNATFAGAVTGSGADYAEYFEWEDGNPQKEDRIGYIVTLDGDKVRFCQANDEILGVVSATAMVIGDNSEWEWQGKYLYDEFGRPITEMKEDFYEKHNIDGTTEMVSLGFSPHKVLNPLYDAEQKYECRADRPEWSTIGLFGKLHIRDDGSCIKGGYAKVLANGIATHSYEKTNMYVMRRISNNVILAFVK